MVVIPTHADDLPEAVLQKLALARLNLVPGVKVWRANTGAARGHDGRVLRFGVPGQADISGLMAPTGRRVEVELKARRGRQTADQIKWEATVVSYGGLYVLGRTLAEVMIPVCEAIGVEYRCEK